MKQPFSHSIVFLRLMGWALLFLMVPGLLLAQPAKHLPEGPGRDLVLNTCTVCHSDSIIKAQQMTREQWDHTITWMQKQQGLWELDTDTRKGILDYLASHFGPGASGEKKGMCAIRCTSTRIVPTPVTLREVGESK